MSETTVPGTGTLGGAESPAKRQPKDPYTCSGCERTWTGPTFCHCAAKGCHRTFSGLGLFEAHRTAEGEHGGCLDPTTLTITSTGPDGVERVRPAMELRKGVWRGPESTPEQIAKLRALIAHADEEAADA